MSAKARRNRAFAGLAAACAAVAASAVLADPRPIPLAINLLLGGALLAAACIDLETFRIPDAITFPLTGAGLAVAMLTADPAPADALAGAALGFSVFALLGVIYRRLRGREGIGLGDAKLFAAAGAWVGALALPTVVLIAAAAGLAHAAFVAHAGRLRGSVLSLRAETMIPFGPAIALAIWLVRLCGDGSAWGV